MQSLYGANMPSWPPPTDGVKFAILFRIARSIKSPARMVGRRGA
jgi:hypothetical protein